MGKLDKIEFHLQHFKICLHFKTARAPLIVHFDTPSRKFYFSLIALIVNEMKHQERPGFVYIRKHEKRLKYFDDTLAEKYASKTVDGMWEKIRKAWHYTLSNLEEAAHFKIEARDLLPPHEKGGRYRYDCSKDESNTWASLFSTDELTNKWRFKLNIDALGLSIDEIVIKYNDRTESSAWKAFLKDLEKTTTSLAPAGDSGFAKPIIKPHQKPWHLYAAAGIAVFLLLLGGAALLNRYMRPAPPQETVTSDFRASIAVLPFVNVSDDIDKNYFCDGITEELINSLARLKDLRVISRTSAFYFKDKGFDLPTIGEKLNVDHILEGSVRVLEDQLKISAQLINVADDSHLWAETYDRKMKDIFETQENLAREIACSLKSQLGCKGDETTGKHYTENIEAYNLYLKGRFLWNRKSHKDAIALYEKALEIDPNYALAYAGLADAYNRLAFWFFDSREEYKFKSVALALKALDVDNTLSEAHTSLGMVKLHFEWDWKGAEEAFEKAIALNPGNSIAHTYYGHLLRATGRIEEALAELTKALTLDPFSRSVNQFYGMMLHVAGRTDQSINHFRTMLELFPDSPEASMLLGRILVENGSSDEGLSLLEDAIKLSNKKSPFPIAFLGYAYGIAGRKNKAGELLNKAVARWEKGRFPAGFIALITMGLGDKDETFRWLQIAFEQRRSSNFALRTIPMYKSLHSDPRWAELMRKMRHQGY